MDFEMRQAWVRLVGRCCNPGYDGYHGVRICDRWKSIEAFVEDVGPRPSKWHGLHRIDKTKGYEPGNVEWREDGVMFEGTRRTVRCWANVLGMEEGTLYARILKRWPLDRAFGQSVRGKARHGRSMWVLRVDGEADGVKFENQLSNTYGSMKDALGVWRDLVSRCLEKGYGCRIDLLRRSPEEADWVEVISHRR